MYIGSAINIGFFPVINIGYRKNIKIDIGTPLVSNVQLVKGLLLQNEQQIQHYLALLRR